MIYVLTCCRRTMPVAREEAACIPARSGRDARTLDERDGRALWAVW
jgi:hypothetical protein